MLVSNPFNTAYDLDRASRGWWVLLVNGIITVVAGGIILYTDWKLSDLAVFIGALLVFRGLFDMFSIPVDGSGRGWTLVSGLLEFGLGVLVWAWPAPTLLVISFWIGWYVLFSGVMTISGAIAGRNVIPYWGFMLALGIGEVLLSFWLLARPGTTLVAAVLAIGLWALIAGVTQIIVAIDIKRLRDQASTSNMDRGLSDTRRDLHHANA
jgi:uncharacterized membrane protein HdeD (DUF308 family)